MSPDNLGHQRPMPGFPRVSGDEPSQPVALLGEAPFSPRERG